MEKLYEISIGRSRKSTYWEQSEISWSELAKKLSLVVRTSETVAEWEQMAKAQRDEIKDVGGFVGGTLKNKERKAVNMASRSLLTLDLDHVPKGHDPWANVTMVLDYTGVLYSTHSHKEESPRLRLVFPLSRSTSSEEYEALSRLIAQDVGIEYCDDTTYQPHRLMYWPSASKNAIFRFEEHQGTILDVDANLGRYSDWKDPVQWPRSQKQKEIPQKLANKQGDPHRKSGIIGAFCRTYSIEAAISEFLSDRYLHCEKNRYSYVHGSTIGGLIVYEEGKFAYSHHSTDPICGMLCNAFDLVRIHLFGEEDVGIAANTKSANYPSFRKMVEKCGEQEEVQKELKVEQLAEIRQMFDDGYEDGNAETLKTQEEKEAESQWILDLEVNPKTGKPLPTIDNSLLILTHDPRMKSSYFFDEFKGRDMVEGDLPWIKLKDRVTEEWTDTDDAGLRWVLEKEYKIDQASKVRDGIDIAMQGKKRHPVRDFLKGLAWDGVPRADSLFIDFLGAEDSIYTREVTRKALLGAVARIMIPGCKHDQVLVLVGPQGCRKSTTLAKLGMDWFSDSLYTMTGKEAYEQLQGAWIIELAEMAASRKAETEQIKAFIAKQVDTYRAAYARRTRSHARQCAFFGTTNDFEFLRDTTGARRFWPVVVTKDETGNRPKLTQDIVEQIWAEVVQAFQNKEAWYLSPELEFLAEEVQKSHTEISGKQGIIEEFLERKLPTDWGDRDLESRRRFWDGSFGEGETGTEVRQRVCALEIWLELFEGNSKTYTLNQGREINNILKQIEGWRPVKTSRFGEIYGTQRGFIRTEIC